jgi:uncharacterized protein
VTSLEPGQLWLMRIHALIAALILAAAAFVAEAALAVKGDLPFGIVLAPVSVLLVYIVLISPGRHFRAWGYAMDADELQIRRGVWIETHTVVPLDRVQHIDLSQGPIERSLAVCRLIVHTAGTQHSRVVLPGLSRANAERMRDEIRARIRQEPE